MIFDMLRDPVLADIARLADLRSPSSPTAPRVTKANPLLTCLPAATWRSARRLGRRDARRDVRLNVISATYHSMKSDGMPKPSDQSVRLSPYGATVISSNSPFEYLLAFALTFLIGALWAHLRCSSNQDACRRERAA